MVSCDNNINNKIINNLKGQIEVRDDIWLYSFKTNF